MKLGSVLLINLLCVAGGVFLYDAWKAEEAPSPGYDALAPNSIPSGAPSDYRATWTPTLIRQDCSPG